jgi:membrane-associated PAP2 superfamily phosphatase
MTELAQAPTSAIPDSHRIRLSDPENFWRAHLVMPLALFLPAFLLFEWFGLDRALAHALFYSPAYGWLGSGSGDGWARGIIHDGGRWLARSAGGTALVMWLASFAFPAARHWRRGAGFVFIAMLASIALVGGLKTITNVDCPWNLAEFGGDRPYISLFAARPHDLPHAQCFPGAHSSSGFALVCFYFLWRDRSRRVARWMLAGACLVGVVFSLGQQARGAHFFTHDFASAAIVWFVQLALYARLLKPRAGHA